MYVEQYLARERQQELLNRAEQERAGCRIAEFRKLKKQQERAEHQLLQAWQRVDHALSVMSAG